MGIPKQVQKQSEEVQELYKELNSETETAQVEKTEATEVPVEQPIEQTSDSVEDQAPKSETQEQVESDAQPKESWEQKYKTLQGMYNADVPRLNAKNREVSARVSQLEQLLSTMQQSTKPEEPVSTDPLITDADMKEYGDSIDVMRRAAREEVNTANGRIAQLEKTIQQLQGFVPQVQQVQAQQQASSEQAFWSGLSNEVPNWQDINDNADFQSWLLSIDPLTGISRQTYLEDAQKNLDTRRVASFFAAWEKEFGTPETARENRSNSNSQLEKQVAPGRGRSGKPASQESKNYSPADIQKFFEDVRKGKFKGREEERGRMERDIFSAQREGRIVTA
jgi:hypothetical protein